MKLSLATQAELNRAIFEFPDLSLLGALAKFLGPERAHEIYQSVAAELNLEVVEDYSLQVNLSVFNGRYAKIEPLLKSHRAIPLGVHDAEIVLGMTNPLDLSAIRAFENLLGQPVVPQLLPDDVYQEIFARSFAELSMKARSEGASRVETSLVELFSFVEDPEVRKALQQVTATAVKHNAERVRIDAALPYVRADFSFSDGSEYAVEISISPQSFLNSLLRRAQVVRRSEDSFTARAEVEFKAIFLSLEITCQHPKGDAQGLIELSSFVLDSPDSPNFWHSLHDEVAAEVRELFQTSAGMIIFAAPSPALLKLALRALSRSYPDCTIIDSSESHTVTQALLARANDRRLIVALQARDDFEALRLVHSHAALEKGQVRGMVFYTALPRLCECCAVTDEDTSTNISELSVPSYIALSERTPRKAATCSLCGSKGFLGNVGAGSVFSTRLIQATKLPQSRKVEETYATLAKEGYISVFERAARRWAEGATTFENVLEYVERPPAEYERERERMRLGKTQDLRRSIEAAQSHADIVEPMLIGSLEFDGPEERLISGRDAFLRVPRVTTTLSEADGVTLSIEEQHAQALATILVIDDDPDQRTILRKVFELEGYRVEVAADGIDGIVSANRICPDIIIVDFMMPDLDGRETISRLKKSAQTASIPIVALTAYPDPDVEFGLLRAGADDFCAKSVSKKVLLKRIERLTQGSR